MAFGAKLLRLKMGSQRYYGSLSDRNVIDLKNTFDGGKVFFFFFLYFRVVDGISRFDISRGVGGRISGNVYPSRCFENSKILF